MGALHVRRFVLRPFRIYIYIFVGVLLAMAKGNEGPPKSVRPPDGIEPLASRKVVEPSRPNSHASIEA